MNICGGIILWGHFALKRAALIRMVVHNSALSYRGRRKLRPLYSVPHWASISLHPPLAAGDFGPPPRKPNGKRRAKRNRLASPTAMERRRKPVLYFLGGGRSAYLSRSSRAGRGFFRRPFPPDPEPPPGRPFSGWGAKGRTDKAVYAYRRDPPGNPE